MGTVIRHTNAPYVAGETLLAADLETDIDNILTQVNGGLDNGNIAAGAGINGTKLASGEVTTTQLSTGAVPQGYVSSATDAANWTASTDAADVPNITAATMTAGSTNDFIFMDFICTARASSGTQDIMSFGFSVNGTDYENIGVHQFSALPHVVHVSYAVTAPVAGSGMIIKPQYKVKTAVNGGFFYVTDDTYRTFRVLVVPTK